MAFQRTQRLTESFEESEALLAGGLDSAIAILKIPEAKFAERVGLDESVGRRIYRKATDTAVFTGHALSLIEESTTHAPFNPVVLEEGLDSPNLDIINVLKDIDGYEDLFGSQNYCRCKHCRSIFGPAAYFVDLMDFIDNHVSQEVFIEQNKTDHPLYLKNRWSNLWTLVLSCKNTDTRIPYLTIVNEVLERYLERVFEEEDIYEVLTEARLSFHQPFNLPFEELRLYLSHFGVSLTDLYEMFSMPAREVARVRLGCSWEEFTTILSPAPEDVPFRFGNPESILEMDAQQVIRHAGINREELDRLCRLDFVKGILTVEIEAESSDNLIGFSEVIQFRQVTDGPFVSLLEPEVRWLLDRLHRFVRLWRKLPWTPEELHLVLVSLLGDDLVSVADDDSHVSIETGLTLFGETVVAIADLRFLQEALGASVEELVALYWEIPTVSVKPDTAPMFTRLFGDVDSLAIAHPALGNPTAENPTVSSDFGILQGALRLTEAEVIDLILMLIPVAVIQTAVLDRPNLSRLYRHARTARLLRLSNRELLNAQSLLQLKGLGLSAITDLQALLTLTRFKQGLATLPFSFGEVHRLVSGASAIDATVVSDTETLLDAVRSDPSRLFTAERLAQVEGVTLADAEALLVKMSHENIAWVALEENGNPDTAQQKFFLAPAYGLIPPFDTLVLLFQEEGNERMASLVQEKATMIQDLLSMNHPQTIFVTHLEQQFNINHAYFQALSPLLSTSLSNAEFVSLLFALSHPGDTSDAEPLSLLIEELKRLLFVLQDKLDFSESTVVFVTDHPKLFQLSLSPGFTFASLRLLGVYEDLKPTAEEDFERFHQALLSWAEGIFPKHHTAFVATLLKTDVQRLQSLSLNLNLPGNALEALANLEQVVRTANTLGMDGAAMKQLTAVDYAGLQAAKTLVYGAIRAKYEEDAWTALSSPTWTNSTRSNAMHWSTVS